MTVNKQISIILPSYNDPRIANAIQSIRCFDDIETVRIVVIDGNSSDEIKHLIRDALSKEDIFISEADKGIFDALNKGLAICNTKFIGWLGSDDMFTGKVPASKVVDALANCDLFIANVAFFRNNYITRITHALPSRLGMTNFGLHNPHYATFGLATLLKSEKFKLGLRSSDIEYFIKIFNKKPRVTSLNVVATLQGEGGFSNSSYKSILRTNLELISVYTQYTNRFLGVVAVMIKLGYKLISRVYYVVFKVKLDRYVRI